MKQGKYLIFAGVILIAMAFGFSACGPAPTPEPTAVPTATAIPPTATEPPAPVLQIIGPAQNVSLSMADLQALPVTEGYAGIKSSTGKITPPMPVKGVALKDLAEVIGGMDETTGFSVVAEDGYSITFSYDQIQNGTFIAYDPATGDELKNPVELTAILVYEMDGQPLDPKEDGTLRLAIVSAELNQVTDGHWSVKWITTLEVKNLGEEWVLQAEGAITKTIDRASVESCGAPQCHGTTWTDDKAQQWVGVPLWLFVGSVDDEIEHEGPAFNDALAEAGYSVDLVAADGYTITLDAARVKRNNDLIVAYKVNENQLPEDYFPLRLVGPDLPKNEMIGQIVQLMVDLEAIPVAEATASEPAATEPPAAGEPITVSEADATLTISGAVNQTVFLNEAALRALDVVKISATNSKGVTKEYEGVRLSVLFALAGVKDSATTIRFTASDGYSVDVSAGGPERLQPTAWWLSPAQPISSTWCCPAWTAGTGSRN